MVAFYFGQASETQSTRDRRPATDKVRDGVREAREKAVPKRRSERKGGELGIS
jgi:hypothetical protein